MPGTRTAERCAQHAPDGMINISKKRGVHGDGATHPSFGVAGARTTEYCDQDAPDGTVNVVDQGRAHGGCAKHPSFEIPGTTSEEYCADVSTSLAVDLRSRKVYGQTYLKNHTHGVVDTNNNIGDVVSEKSPDEDSVSPICEIFPRNSEKRTVVSMSTIGGRSREFHTRARNPDKQLVTSPEVDRESIAPRDTLTYGGGSAVPLDPLIKADVLN